MQDELLELARHAGNAILAIYRRRGPVEVQAKGDGSPLTLADRASHEVLVQGLEKLDPGVPVLSEESSEIGYEVRRHWERFWLVDPLDGTKEFVKGGGDFTVNVARIESGRPTFGLVLAPVLDVAFMGSRGRGAWKIEGDGSRTRIEVRPARTEALVGVMSLSHAGPELAALKARYPSLGIDSMGSSLKFCLVAEGKADFYPRSGPTMEWDTAAAQCVVEEAGGTMRTLEGREFAYNKPELRNPGFLVTGDPDYDWSELAAVVRDAVAGAGTPGSTG